MFTHAFKTVFILKLLLLLSPTFFAQTKTIPFQNISAGSGLDINFIYNITQDKQGFMWFGTFNGLVRYDGYNFRNYSFEDGSGLKSKRVNHVEEDKYGNLWVVSGRWLQVYDRESDSFHNMNNLDGDTIFRYSNSRVNPIMVKDEKGTIWMRSNDGLFRIKPHKKPAESIIECFRYNSGDSTSIGHNAIQALFVDSRQRLWIGTDAGLYIFNSEKESIESCPVGEHKPITALCETADGKICVGTEGAGFYLYDPTTRTVSKFLEDKKNLYSLAGESVFQITRDGKDNIWLFTGSFQSKVFSLQKFDQAHGRFQTSFRSQRAKGGNASLGGIGFYLFKDRAGYLWIVGEKGLHFYDPYLEIMYDIRERENHLIDWSGISTFYEDRTGVLWIGTASTGLLKYAPSTHKFKNFKPEPEPEKNENIAISFLNPVFIDSRDNLWLKAGNGTIRYIFDEKNNLQQVAHYPFNVFSLLEDSKGLFWLTTSDGTKYFDPKTEKFLAPPDSPILKIPGLKELEDDEGWIWSRTFGRGLFRFNPTTSEVINFRHDPDDPNSISSDFLGGVLLKDSDGTVWVGGYGGLKKYHSETGYFSSYLKGIATTDLHEDEFGRIWVTTEGRGLYCFDKKTGDFRKYSKKEGFPANRTLFILEDKHGDLWISSDEGLIHFRPESESWNLFTRHDGLPTPVFAYGACKRKNGEMFFSLRGGEFIRFHPDSLQADTFKPKAVFTDFKLFNKPVAIGGDNSPLNTSVWTTDHIVLNHNQNVFSLEFSAFHFAAPDENEFAWLMEGIDHEWNYAGNQRIVNFAGLQPENYVLKVKAANHDGLWGEEKALKITILPPWWETWWAYSLYVIFIGINLWGINAFLKRRWRLKAQLALEHREAERLKELDAVKTRLYTNITHEFRTPLTIILGMARQVRENPEDWFREGLKMIIRNGQNLLQLVNQMLDLSKLESSSMPVNFIQGNILTYLKYLLESFHSMAKSKDIRLHFQADLEKLVIDYDPDKIREIVSNLLSNAIKFTPENGNIYLNVSTLYMNRQMLQLKVKDTGIGIPAEKLPQIFNRFYQADDSATRMAEGTGIGLALTKELVKLLDGDISVESEIGKGTEFIVELPVSNFAPFVTEVEKTKIKTPILPLSTFPVGEESQSVEMPVLLIVEDNADVVLYLKSFLQNKYSIEVARDGQQGVHKAIEIIPDIIISDVMMPVMDGFELCDELKKDLRTSHIPIILLTAKADDSSRIKGLERGADAFLQKPFNKQELQVRLQKLMESRKRLHERYRNLSLPVTDDKDIQYEDAFMQKVRASLEVHLSDEYFGVSELCKELGMSRAQLYRKFKGLTDQPVGLYFRSLRLSKAKELLLSTNLHISEIAYEVGFKDPAYFSRVFKEEFGRNPSEIR